MEIEKRVNRILEKYDICDTCLGRQFHSLYPNKSNREIGEFLKSKFPEYKKRGQCYLCNDIFENLDSYIRRIERKLKEYEFNSFLIGSEFSGELISKEEKFWEEQGVDFCEAIKSNFNREIGIKLKNSLGKKIDFENPDLMIIIKVGENKIKLQISPLYVEGGYKKILPRREIQKIIERAFLRKSRAKKVIFYSVGRLEKKVITSCYRPFLLKLKSPVKRRLNLKEIEEKINQNKSIKIGKLKYSGKEKIDDFKKKFLISYSIVLEFKDLREKNRKQMERELSNLKNRRIYQNLKGKVRRPKINKVRVRWKRKKLILFLQTTEEFSISDFIDKSKPNLKNIIGEKFKVKEICIRNYKKLRK